MDDRTLLELAAKAAGMQIVGPAHKWAVVDDQNSLLVVNEQGGHTIWNSLTSNDNALRLAVTLDMDINAYPNTGEVAAVQHRQTGIYQRCFERTREDKHAATRRAITRAAAEIELAKSRVSAPGAVEGER